MGKCRFPLIGLKNERRAENLLRSHLIRIPQQNVQFCAGRDVVKCRWRMRSFFLSTFGPTAPLYHAGTIPGLIKHASIKHLNGLQELEDSIEKGTFGLSQVGDVLYNVEVFVSEAGSGCWRADAHRQKP